jgi:hypothetical protein
LYKSFAVYFFQTGCSSDTREHKHHHEPPPRHHVGYSHVSIRERDRSFPSITLCRLAKKCCYPGSDADTVSFLSKKSLDVGCCERLLWKDFLRIDKVKTTATNRPTALAVVATAFTAKPRRIVAQIPLKVSHQTNNRRDACRGSSFYWSKNRGSCRTRPLFFVKATRLKPTHRDVLAQAWSVIRQRETGVGGTDRSRKLKV